MPNTLEKLEETTAYLRGIYSHTPVAGIVLGSGLGEFASRIEVEREVDYKDIPHFPVSTVKGHKGKLIFGKVAGKQIVAMSGRFHYYEGYSPEEVVFPVRVMARLGIKLLLLSNAAGGVNPDFKVGDLMIIRDHISFATVNPLIGKNEEALGPRFPDMTEPYKKSFIDKAKAAAARLSIDVKEGVYFGVTGPTFETRSEYKMIHLLGADAVGMSTVQENIAAVHMGVPVFAMSVITDLGLGDHEKITHEEVLAAANAAEPRMTAIILELIAAL